MKKKFFMYVMMLFAVVMGSVVFSSCSEDKIVDEDGNYTDRALVGKWKSDVYGGFYAVFEFKSNGTGNAKEYRSDDNNRWVISDDGDFTWTYNSETCKLTLIDDDYDQGDKVDVEWIDKDKIEIEDVIFTRQ